MSCELEGREGGSRFNRKIIHINIISIVVILIGVGEVLMSWGGFGSGSWGWWVFVEGGLLI